MGISMISIILYHQHFISFFPFTIFHKCGYWGVDVFLLLSGIGMVRSFQINTMPAFYKRRFLRLLPACVVCGFLKSLIRIIVEGGDPLSRISIMGLTGMELWFIRAIIFYYAFSPLLIYVIRKKTIVTMSLITTVYIVSGLFFRVHDPSSFTWIVERLFVFSLGICLAVKQEYLKNNTLSASMVVFCITFVTTMITGRPFNSRFFNTILMLAVATGTVGLCQICIYTFRMLPKVCLKFCMLFGKFSLELYLIHQFIFNYLEVYWSEQYYPFAFILGTSLALAISFACHSVLSKNQFLNLGHS